MALSGPGELLARVRDHDLYFSFKGSKITIVAGITAAVIMIAALLAPWITPQNPFNPAELNLLDAFTPPAWVAGGQLAVRSRDRRSKPRHVFGNALWRAQRRCWWDLPRC